MRECFRRWMLVLSVFLWVHSHLFYSNFGWWSNCPVLGFTSADGKVSIFHERSDLEIVLFAWDYMNANSATTSSADWLSTEPTILGAGFTYDQSGTCFCVPYWLLALFWYCKIRLEPPSRAPSSALNWAVAVAFVVVAIPSINFGFPVALSAGLLLITLGAFFVLIFQQLRTLLEARSSSKLEATILRPAIFMLVMFLWPYSYIYHANVGVDNPPYSFGVGRVDGETSVYLYTDTEGGSAGYDLYEDYGSELGRYCPELYLKIDPVHFGFAASMTGFFSAYCVPYWLLVAFWFPLTGIRQLRCRVQFRVIHLLGLMTYIAIVVACVMNGASILLDVALHLATLSIVAAWFWRQGGCLVASLRRSQSVDSHERLPTTPTVSIAFE